jgi:hypothetical protein
MPNQTLPASNNPDWGFSTIRDHADLAQAWPMTVVRMQEQTGCSAFGVRDFLDSRHGRHFADDVINNLHSGLPLDSAVEAAIDRWMAWRTCRALFRDYGIPTGMPYLTGLVGHHDILSDLAVCGT